MTSPRVRLPWLRAGGFGAVGLALVAVACEAPGPVQTSPPTSGTRVESVQVAPARTELATTTESRVSHVRISRAAIDAAVRAHYPEVFQAAATDTSTLLFVLTPDGEVERHERVKMRRAGPAPANMAEAQGRWRETSGLSTEEMGSTIVDIVGFTPGQMGPGFVEVLWIRRLAADPIVTTTERDTLRASGRTQFRTTAPGAPREAEITAEQARAYVERYMPQVARNGTTAEFVWFLADARGQIIRHGDAATSEAINSRVNDLHAVQTFRGESVTINGHQIPVVYARLKG